MSAPRLELDYVAAVRRPCLPGLALLACALLFAGVLVERYRAVRLETERIETAQALLAGGARPASMARASQIAEDARSAQAVMRRLALPWPLVIEAVEEAATRDVALLRLQPDAQQGNLRLAGEARNEQAMFEFLGRLGAAPGLSDVYIVSHAIRHADPAKPLEFTVRARFGGAS